MNAQAFAAALKRMRREAGFSQRKLAEISGVGVKTISSFETGKRVEAMKVAQLLRLAKACHVQLQMSSHVKEADA